jgi:hypothetical protein
MDIQLDYGGFDPTFIGITLRFSTESAWANFIAFGTSEDAPDVVRLAPGGAFQIVSITSVASHETRHFHDFLLSPYSAVIFKLRVQELCNALQILMKLSDAPGNCIPVPITAWCGLTQAERDRELAYLQPKNGSGWIPVPVEIPFIERAHVGPPPKVVYKNALNALLRGAIVNRRCIDNLINNPDFAEARHAVQPWQVFELSGLLVQLQEIWHTYGSRETQLFADYLMSHANNPYAAMMRIVGQMWRFSGGGVDTVLASAMVAWSLLGSYEKDKWRACPSERFARLFNCLSREHVKEDPEDLMNLWDGWSRLLGLSTVKEGLEETQKTYRRLSALLDENIFNYPDLAMHVAIGPLLQRVVKGVMAASTHMTEQFSKDPIAYVAPQKYLENTNNFASPIIRFMFEGCGLAVSESLEELKRNGVIAEIVQREDGSVVIVSQVERLNSSAHTFVEPDDVVYLSQLFGLSDFLFADTARARRDVQREGRSYFEGLTLTPFEVLARPGCRSAAQEHREPTRRARISTRLRRRRK